MAGITASAQDVMTPELLWKLGRISPLGISNDGKNIIYKVSTPSMEENKSNSEFYSIPIAGGNATSIKNYSDLIQDKNKHGEWTLTNKEVKIDPTHGKDFYPELDKSEVQIFNALDYRHWDTYNDGHHNHVILTNAKNEEIDILSKEPYDCPQKPFGGDEDYIWSPDGSKVIYVCKKKTGTEYATSTNTDLYEYDIATKTTKNLTKHNQIISFSNKSNEKLRRKKSRV